jgi:hypothetical protein
MTQTAESPKRKESTRGFLWVVDRATTKDRLRALRNDLQFLDRGGYRSPIRWWSARTFEDSPTCPKDQWSACPHGDCVLLDFVPEQSRHEAIPCRYIPLDESCETLETLYSTATNEEIQKTLREWLLKTIAGLEPLAESEMPGRDEKAG